MKLIGRPALLRQLLFACLGSLLLGAVGVAQDTIIFKNGPPASANILSVEKGQIMIEIPGGKTGRSLATVQEVRKAAPPEYNAAVAAYEKGDYAKAMQAAQVVVGRFKGLPTPWARQATSMLGDIHAAQGETDKAIAAYEDFQKSYPGADGGGASDVGSARVLVMQKKYDEAKKKLVPVTEAALKEKTASGATALAYSQAFYLLAQVQEAQGELVPALENYLRTATLFRQDRAAAAAAQAKADALRKGSAIHVP